MNKTCYVILTVILSGCATQVPAPISTIPAGNLTVSEVRAGPDRFAGSEVRWGGVITKVENKASQTWIEVVSRALKKNGQPRVDSGSSGRFIAIFPEFVDPVVYSAGQLLTVVGTIEGETTGRIGEYDYSFPLVAVNTSYLWPKKAEPVRHEYYPPPWWYYDPWPYYPRPFYGRPHPPYRR